jgi:hypothetical protein
MAYRIFGAFALMLFLANCAQYQQAMGPGAAGPAPAGGQVAPAPGGESPGAAEPNFPKTVSVSIKVECRDSVDVFYGKDPKFGSGTSSRLGGNSLQNHTFMPGDMMWITDEQRNGTGSVTISENTHDVVVACNGISAR